MKFLKLSPTILFILYKRPMQFLSNGRFLQLQVFRRLDPFVGPTNTRKRSERIYAKILIEDTDTVRARPSVPILHSQTKKEVTIPRNITEVNSSFRDTVREIGWYLVCPRYSVLYFEFSWFFQDLSIISQGDIKGKHMRNGFPINFEGTRIWVGCDLVLRFEFPFLNSIS